MAVQGYNAAKELVDDFREKRESKRDSEWFYVSFVKEADLQPRAWWIFSVEKALKQIVFKTTSRLAMVTQPQQEAEQRAVQSETFERESKQRKVQLDALQHAREMDKTKFEDNENQTSIDTSDLVELKKPTRLGMQRNLIERRGKNEVPGRTYLNGDPLGAPLSSEEELLKDIRDELRKQTRILEESKPLRPDL